MDRYEVTALTHRRFATAQAELANGFAEHATMGAEAMLTLGLDPSAVLAWADRHDPVPVPIESSLNVARDAVVAELADEDWRLVLRRHVVQLASSLDTHLFHGLIRTAHAGRGHDGLMATDDVAWLDTDELAAWMNLIKLASRIVTLSDTELRRTRSITGRDYELLHHLSLSDTGWRVNELADLIDDTSSCITHRVNRLSVAGLVDKQPDPTDQRARCVALTPAGRALLDETAPEHVARVRSWIIDALGRPDLVELARIAGLLNQHLRTVAPPTI